LRDVSKDDTGFAFLRAIVKVLGETLDQTSASASQQDQDRIAQLFKNKVGAEMVQLRQAYPPATSSACVPIAAPKAPLTQRVLLLAHHHRWAFCQLVCRHFQFREMLVQ